MDNSTHFDVAGESDVGRVRRVNEDAFLVSKGLLLMAVADGMGGHGAGDRASKLAIEYLSQALAIPPDSLSTTDNEQQLTEQSLACVKAAIEKANALIYKENVENGYSGGRGMGTTLVGLYLIAETQKAITFNIGDSRLYQFHDTTLSPLTHDHTLYQNWLDNGEHGAAPPRNIITQAVGLSATVNIDLELITLKDDALYLLCSDGLTSMLDDQEISEVLAQEELTVAQLNSQLIELANARGGLDNTTVVTMKASKP